MIAPFGGFISGIGFNAQSPYQVQSPGGITPYGTLSPLPPGAYQTHTSTITAGQEAFNLLNAQFTAGPARRRSRTPSGRAWALQRQPHARLLRKRRRYGHPPAREERQRDLCHHLRPAANPVVRRASSKPSAYTSAHAELSSSKPARPVSSSSRSRFSAHPTSCWRLAAAGQQRLQLHLQRSLLVRRLRQPQSPIPASSGGKDPSPGSANRASRVKNRRAASRGPSLTPSAPLFI